MTVHLRNPDYPARNMQAVACGDPAGRYTPDPGQVTCFTCRKTPVFQAVQLGGGPPPPQDETPKPLRAVLAEDAELLALAKRRAERLKAWRNERDMFVVEERIHHGDYRSTRRMEVRSIDAVTVDAVLQSSPYCYGSYLRPDNPAHTEVRRAKVHEMVADLIAGREHRNIGWSTFRIITTQESEH